MTVKGNNLEVEVVHECFTGIGDSILGAFSWSCDGFVNNAEKRLTSSLG